MNIVFLGNTKYSALGAEIIHQTNPITAVVTTTDRPLGRKKILTPSPTKIWSLEHNVPVIEADKLDEQAIEKIKTLQPDFLIVEDYGLILPQAVLDLPKYAPINIHHSLLPRYRGASPAPTAILEGDSVTGVTLIEMTAEVDAGDMLIQKEYTVSPDDTTDSLLATLNTMGASLIAEVLEKYRNGTITKTPQDHSKATFTKKYGKQEAYIDIKNPPAPDKLDRMIRAFYPWLNVWTSWNGKIVKLYPGKMIQMEGKQPTPLKNFLNGYPDFPLKDL